MVTEIKCSSAKLVKISKRKFMICIKRFLVCYRRNESHKPFVCDETECGIVMKKITLAKVSIKV